MAKFSKLGFFVGSFLAVSSVFATPVNLVQNGSFEKGLAGWTLGGVQGSTPATAIFYNSTGGAKPGASGEAVGPANSVTASPDAAGNRAAYFIADNAINATLSQTIFLAAGIYEIGFDAYAPKNGYANRFDASFSAAIAGVTLANYMVSQGPVTDWINYSGLATIVTDGDYLVSFLFNTPGMGAAKDIVLDRVFVVASSGIGGAPISSVPEPSSLALMGLAFAGLIWSQKRKQA